MQLTPTKDRTREIQAALSELNQSLRMTVQKAIHVGELLTAQKEHVGHGNFLPWLEANVDLSERTARNYMKLHEYRNKTATIADLQTAYQQIETLEAQERQSREERDRSMIAEYRRTGTKPEGWDRSLDYRIKKDAEAGAKQQERIERERQEREQRAQEYKEQGEKTYRLNSNVFAAATDALLKKLDQREEWKEKIRLSDGGKEDAFMDAIIEYLEGLESDTRRIEACNNIIKICRNISVELQRG